jgi:RNA polymerase sigma factor (sigma-70 family)
VGSSSVGRTGFVDVTDAGFLASLTAGDPEATEWLLDRLRAERLAGPSEYEGLRLFARAFEGKLVAFLERFFAGDKQVALDAWNETLYRVRTRVDCYDAELSQFRTWATNEARYAALGLLRTWRRWREMPRLTNWPDAAMEERDPLTAAERAAIQRAFARLRERERDLLFYRFVLEWKPSELARDLFGNMTEGHVRVALHRAIERARRYYLEELNQFRLEPSRQAGLVSAYASAPAWGLADAAGREAGFVGMLATNLRLINDAAVRAANVALPDRSGSSVVRALSDEEVDALYRSLPETPTITEAQLEQQVAKAAARPVTKSGPDADKG